MMRIFQTRQRLISVLLGIIILAAFVAQFVPFLTPLLLATIFAFGLEPKVSHFTARKSSRRLGTLGFIFIFVFAIAGPVTFVLNRVANKLTMVSRGGVQNTQLFQSLERIKDHFADVLANISPEFSSHLPMGDGSFLNKMSASVMAGSATFAAGLPDFIIAFFVFLAALYFLVMQANELKNALIQLDFLHRQKLEQLIHASQRICYNTLVSSVVIGAIQATIITVGSLLCGYHEPLMIFVVTFFVSFIPIIGAGPVAMVLAVNSFIIGENGAGFGMLVFSLLGGSIDNLLKPYILSHAEEDMIHPVISVLAFVGAVLVYGFPGLLLGPVLLQMAYQLVPILFSREENT